MQYGFSSMGAPGLALPELLDIAQEFGMQFVELRTLEGTTDLPAYAAEHNLLTDCRRPGISIRSVASDFHLDKADEMSIAKLVQFAKLAEALNSPYVRIFGGWQPCDMIGKKELSQAANAVEMCRKELKQLSLKCELLLETHFGFSSSDPVRRLNEQLKEPLFVLWDSHHTWRRGRETPAETWQSIGPWVRHIHYKDSRMNMGTKGDGVYMLPGEGEYPAGELMELLKSSDYPHGVCLEWEKLWHPEIPDLRDALSAFTSVVMGRARLTA